MHDQPPPIAEQLKQYGLNLAQVALLIVLLIIPAVVGNYVIRATGLTEVNHYFDFFQIFIGLLFAYFLAMVYFHNQLISRLHDLVYIKYLVVILILFWIVYDGYMAYIFQKAYQMNENSIIRRDIVWSDVAYEDLPNDVIYPNFRFAYLGLVSVFRFSLLSLFAYKLMSEYEAPSALRKPSSKRKAKAKSLDEIKANLHPSILKQYKKKDGDKADD